MRPSEKQRRKIRRTDKAYVSNQTRWVTHLTVDADGSAYVDEDNNFKYDVTYGELQKQFLVLVRIFLLIN